MRFFKHSAVLLLTAGSFFACSSDGDSDGGEGGAPSTTGGATGTTGGAPGATGGAPGATGGTDGGNTGGTDGATGGTTGGTCTPLATGVLDESTSWWAGTSEASTDAVIGSDNKSISDATGIEGLDDWGGPTGWANISYAFGAAGACVDASAASTISISVTSVTEGPIRISLKTEATDATANHYQKTETFAANETKVVTLNLDGTGLTQSWAGATTEPWDPAHLLSIVVIPLGTNDTGLAPYDISADAVTVN